METKLKIYYCNEKNLLTNYYLVYYNNGILTKVEDYKNGILISDNNSQISSIISQIRPACAII